MISAVAVTPNNRYIVGGHGSRHDHPGHITFWDFKTGSLVRVDRWKPDDLECILATPDNRSIIISGRDDNYFHDGTHYIVVGDIETAKYETIKAARYFPLDLFFSWDKQQVKFGEYALDWRKKENFYTRSKEIEFNGVQPKFVELSQDYSVTTDDENYIVKDTKTNQVIRRLNAGHNNEYYKQTYFKVSADNRYLFAQSGHQFITQDEVLCMWDLQTSVLIKCFESCRGRIHSIDITSDNQFIIAAIGYEPNSAIIVVDVQTDEVVLKIEHETFHK